APEQAPLGLAMNEHRSSRTRFAAVRPTASQGRMARRRHELRIPHHPASIEKDTLMTTATNRRIAIIGSGPGGLTAARVLQRHGVAVTVYERDAAADARAQGGTLDMQAPTG